MVVCLSIKGLSEDMNMKIKNRLSSCCQAIFTMVMAANAMAQTIVIAPNTVISHSKTYDNVTLDMSRGSFIIKDNAVLEPML